MLPVAFSIAAVLLGHAIQLGNGTINPDSFPLMVAALILAVAGVVSPPIPKLERFAMPAALVVLAAGLAFQLAQLLVRPPAMYQNPGPEGYRTLLMGVAVAGVLGGGCLARDRWTPRVVVPLLILVHFVLGAWIIRTSPAPHIDVYYFHRQAIDAVLQGISPHANGIPNIYGHTAFYGPGVANNAQVLVGFPYPPLSLLFALMGHAFGDYRYAELTAMAITGALLAYARPGQLGALAAAVFLFTPRTLFVLEQGWTETFVAMVFAATLFVALRYPRWLFVALGALFAIKQYMPFVAPAVFLLVPRTGTLRERLLETLKLVGKAAAVAAAITLPVFLWSPGGFINDILLFQVRQPFRAEALSFFSWLAQKNGSPPGSWLTFAVLIPATALGLWRAPRTVGGFAAVSTLVLFAFFAFSKQAFCNYYFLIVAVLCATVAVADLAPSRPEANTT